MTTRVTLGMVATPHRTASDAGMEILRSGGNAFDAAVAAAFALGVVTPASTGLAGYGGCLIAWLAGRDEPVAVDFTSRAPAAAHDTMFLADEDGRGGFSVRGAANAFGGLAVDIPGVAAGLALVLRRFGTLPLETVMRPAIASARQGFPVDTWTVQKIAETLQPHAERYPEAFRLFSVRGRPPRPGDMMTNPDLARTLEAVARNGAREFYQGELARAIVHAVRADGGILTLEDLASYTPQETAPLSVSFRGHTVWTPPLPAGGLTVLQMLRVLEGFTLPHSGDDADLIHLLVEVAKPCWRERLTKCGDPEVVIIDSAAELGDGRVETLRGEVSHGLKAPRPGEVIAPDPLLTGTVHLCTADHKGNVVSLTTTMGGSFGSLLAVPETGLVLGHGISRFDPRPQRPNSIGPRKRPMHNMSPMLVTRGRRPVLALGVAGGRTILSTLVYSLARLIGLGHPPDAAISTTRFHIETAEPVLIEEGGDALAAELTRRGHVVALRPRFGSLQGIAVGDTPDAMSGIADPRRDGAVRWA